MGLGDQAITLNQFLTQKQIEAAWKIYEEVVDANYAGEQFARRCEKAIIEPNIGVIQTKLGQQCDSRYLAYLCEHAFNQAVRRLGDDIGKENKAS